MHVMYFKFYFGHFLEKNAIDFRNKTDRNHRA